MDWRPDIGSGEGFIHQRILRALEGDIASGRLAPDTRLPPHRTLSHRLGVGVGAVTQAYAQAEARGLIVAHVGRGSFVAGPRSHASPEAVQPGVIDLARNTAPSLMAATHLGTALARLKRRSDLTAHLAYPPPAGLDSHRAAGADWIRRTTTWSDCEPDQVICTGGAQQAIAVALSAACRPGGRVIVESATFSGVISLAAHMNYTLVPAAMDARGVTPEGLDRAVEDSGARVAYLQPLQNPTGRIMDLERRRSLIATARGRGLLIVEDDLYGAYAQEMALPPLAALAPERVFYVNGLSKSLTPGLRVGYLVPPRGEDWRDRCLRALRAIAFGPPGLAGLIAAQWIEDGTADDILAAHRAELTARAAMGLDVLPSAERPANRSPTHLWLPMSEREAQRVAGQAALSGVHVTPPDASAPPGAREHGLRLCLGAAPNRAVLAQGLMVVARALTQRGYGALDLV